ncbi:uncharacterized protein LOC144180417 [Haemaphysalis longicornis]
MLPVRLFCCSQQFFLTVLESLIEPIQSDPWRSKWLRMRRKRLLRSIASTSRSSTVHFFFFRCMRGTMIVRPTPADPSGDTVSHGSLQFDRSESLRNGMTAKDKRLHLGELFIFFFRMMPAGLELVLNSVYSRLRKAAQFWLLSADDVSYFESYDDHTTHLKMLSDRPRMDSYRRAIELNADACIRGCTVLDVGCGTGILSMLCARAGARFVTGVDRSNIVFQAMDIVRENGLSDKVSVVWGTAEELELPDRVDVLVSEWMGHFLLSEGMLESVIDARDRLLKPGGLMLPSRCHLYLAALNDPELHQEMVGFWGNVEGFRMSCMRKEMLAEAHVLTVTAAKVCSTRPALLLNLDLNMCRMEDTDFATDFELELLPGTQRVTALVGYFDCIFELPVPVVLSTAVDAEPTHWQHTVFLLEEPHVPAPGETTIRGRLECRREGKRGVKVTITIGPRKQQYAVLGQ